MDTFAVQILFNFLKLFNYTTKQVSRVYKLSQTGLEPILMLVMKFGQQGCRGPWEMGPCHNFQSEPPRAAVARTFGFDGSIV